MHFIGRDIAGLRQNIYFQPQKVGGQRIGFAHKDWKVGGQLPALPNRLRRLCLELSLCLTYLGCKLANLTKKKLYWKVLIRFVNKPVTSLHIRGMPITVRVLLLLAPHTLYVYRVQCSDQLGLHSCVLINWLTEYLSRRGFQWGC